jgi:hypothetical protein
MRMALFYFGDPGYAMTTDEWNNANNLFFEDQHAAFYEFSDGRQFVMKRWDFGDMGGTDKDGFQYSCDSGCYGFIKVTDIDDECMPTINIIAEQNGCRFIDLDVDSVAEAVGRGLGPFPIIPLSWQECSADDEAHEMIKNQAVTGDIVRYLIKHHKINVCTGGVESCLSVDELIFDSLLDDKDEDVAEFASEVLLHKKLPKSWQTLLPWEKVSQLTSESPPLEVLEVFKLSSNSLLRLAVASNESTPRDLLHFLATDEDEEVSFRARLSIEGPIEWRRLSWEDISLIIKSKKLSPSLLEFLTSSPLQSIRLALIKSPSITSDLLEILKGDSSHKVAFQARKRLESLHE